jgi:putative ABC transport system permease protein
MTISSRAPIFAGAVHDFRYALGNVRRKPGFAVSVIALFALGVGTATSVFSVVDRVLFRALPYSHGDRLVSLGIRIPWLEYDFLPAGSYFDLRDRPGPFTALTSWSGVVNCDWTDERPVRLGCAAAEANFLPVLGVEPVLGRNFTKEEDLPNAAPVALISNALWKLSFGGDTSAVGRHVSIDGRQTLIIGILPADFETPTLDRADVLLPQNLAANVASGARVLRICARLKDGLTPERARDKVMAGADRLLRDVPPQLRKQVEFHVRSLRELQTGDFRLASLTLLAGVMAMLLIACANAANLLFARSVARQREFSIRMALGAGRARILRQLLTEALVLGLAGGVLGCAMAFGQLRLFVAIAPAGIPHLAAASLDWRVLLFGIAAALFSSAAAGLVSMLHSPKEGWWSGVRTTGGIGLFTRRLLVGSQLAASLILLTSAGLLLESLWNRQAVSLGIRVEGVVVGEVALGARYAQPASRAAFYERLEARLRQLPGVESVGFVDTLPPGGVPRSQPLYALTVQGMAPLDQGTPGIVVWRSVTPEYFRAMAIPIVRGRVFTEDDRRPGATSIIISAAYARRLFGDSNPVGRRIARYPGTPANPAPWYEIVGVAADARNAGLTDNLDPEYYLVRRHGSTGYEDAPPVSAAIIRGTASRAKLESWMRAEIAALDPALPATVRTMEEEVGGLAARPRFQAWLLAMFAVLGLLLSALGVYGLVGFVVSQREREFGIRLTLGATPAGIVRMMLKDAFGWAAGGLIAGLAGAAVAARLLGSLLFHVSPGAPGAYAGAAALLAAFALVAAFLPSRRAGRVDPATTLRHE